MEALALPTDVGRKLEGLAKQIDRAKARGLAAMFEIAGLLKSAHDELANNRSGTFGKWVQERCGFTVRTANNYLAVHESFGDRYSESLSKYATAETLYFLAKDSTPEEAVTEAIELAEQGERITIQRAKQLVAKHLPEPEPDPPEEPTNEDDTVLEASEPNTPLAKAVAKLNDFLNTIPQWCPREYVGVIAEKLIEAGERLQTEGAQ